MGNVSNDVLTKDFKIRVVGKIFRINRTAPFFIKYVTC
jgi:hypothetical protein